MQVMITTYETSNTQQQDFISQELFKSFFDKFMKFCTICQSVKPPRAHHCKVCNRCVMRMDHHCGFVVNCIGKLNLKFFINFNFYLVMLCTYSAALFITVAVQCLLDEDNDDAKCHAAFSDKNSFLSIFNYLMIVGTGSLAFIIGLFCFCLLIN